MYGPWSSLCVPWRDHSASVSRARISPVVRRADLNASTEASIGGEISDDTPFAEHLKALQSVPGLEKAVEEHFSPASDEELAIGMELVLEGLTQHLKIARQDLDSRISYAEMLKFNLVRSRS